MGPHERSWSYSVPYPHTWPGQVKQRYTGRHHKRRKQRALARRAK